MKTTLKILGGTLAVLILLGIGLSIYFTDERLKRAALPYLSEVAGQPVEIETMSLTFFSTFPHPGLTAGGVFVPGGAHGDSLLSLKRLTVGVKLLPLFRRNVRVTEIQLDKPRFEYRVFEDGSTNLDPFFADTAGSGSTWSVSAPYLQVEEGHLSYRNDATGDRLALSGLGGNISLQYDSLITSTARIRVESISTGSGSERQVSEIPLTLSQRSVVNMEEERMHLEEGNLSVRGLTLDLQGSVNRWSDGSDLDLRFQSSTGNFGELLGLLPAGYVEGLETRGELELDGSVTGTAQNGTIPSFELNVRVRDGYVKNPDLPRAIEQIQLTARATNEALVLTELTARSGENSLRGSGSLRNPLEQNGAFEAEFSADVEMRTVPEFYDVTDLGLQELGGQLTADVTLKGNRSRPEETNYDGTFRLRDGSLRYQDLTESIRNIQVEAVAQQDRIIIQSLGMEAAGNSLTVSGSVRHPFDTSRTVDLDTGLNLDLSTLNRFYPVTGDSLAVPGLLVSLSGSLRSDLNVSGPLSRPGELIPRGSLTIDNVAFSGENLPSPVRRLNGELQLTSEAATIHALDFELGESQIAVNGSLSNYRSWLRPAAGERTAPPRLEGSFQSDYLDIDQWIDWDDTSSAAYHIQLPHLESEVDARVTEMKLTGVTLRDVRGNLAGSPLRIRLLDGSAQLLGGGMTGSITWNVPRPDRTEVLFEGSLDSLQVGSFLEEYPVLGAEYRLGEYVEGVFNAQVEYRSELDEYLTPLLSTTSVSGRFGMGRTRFQGHPLQQRVADLLNIEELRRGDLDSWSSTFRVENSMMRVDSVRMTSSNIGVGLSGSRHLAEGKIDYRLRLYLPGRFREAIASVITPQATDALSREDGTIMVPLRFTGTMSRPRLAPDKEVIQPILERHLKEAAGGILKKLFDNRP